MMVWPSAPQTEPVAWLAAFAHGMQLLSLQMSVVPMQAYAPFHRHGSPTFDGVPSGLAQFEQPPQAMLKQDMSGGVVGMVTARSSSMRESGNGGTSNGEPQPAT